jgi:hypothetical protein
MGTEFKMDKVLPWDRFRDWIHCIAVVTFDLELGQTLEVGLVWLL